MNIRLISIPAILAQLATASTAVYTSIGYGTTTYDVDKDAITLEETKPVKVALSLFRQSPNGFDIGVAYSYDFIKTGASSNTLNMHHVSPVALQYRFTPNLKADIELGFGRIDRNFPGWGMAASTGVHYGLANFWLGARWRYTQTDTDNVEMPKYIDVQSAFIEIGYKLY